MFSSLHRNDRLLSDHRPEINESNFGSVVRHPFFVKKNGEIVRIENGVLLACIRLHSGDGQHRGEFDIACGGEEKEKAGGARETYYFEPSLFSNARRSSPSSMDGDFIAKQTVNGFCEVGATSEATIRTYMCIMSEPRCPNTARAEKAFL